MENLERCYRMLVEEKFIRSEELPLVNSWISDFEK
jgi:hypothetical protein